VRAQEASRASRIVAARSLFPSEQHALP